MAYDCKITIEGRPIPKERPRMSKSGHTYTPQKTREAEEVISNIVIEQVDWVTEADIRLEARFYFNKRNYPDGDNLLKLLMDSINKSKRIWKDDKQVSEFEVKRIYDKNEQERTEFTIEILDF